MLGRNINMQIHSNGDVFVFGIEQPTGQLIHMYGDYIVVKVPGRQYWSGIGMKPGYAGAEYQIYKVIGQFEDKPGTFKCEEIMDFPVRPDANEPMAQAKRMLDKQWSVYEPTRTFGGK